MKRTTLSWQLKSEKDVKYICLENISSLVNSSIIYKLSGVGSLASVRKLGRLSASSAASINPSPIPFLFILLFSSIHPLPHPSLPYHNPPTQAVGMGYSWDTMNFDWFVSDCFNVVRMCGNVLREQ